MIKNKGGMNWRRAFLSQATGTVSAAFLVAATASATLGCSDGAAESGSEETAVSTEAVDYGWLYIEQSYKYSFAYNMACAQHALNLRITCGLRTGSGSRQVPDPGSTPIGYEDQPSDPAVTAGFDSGNGNLKYLVRSIALEDVNANVCVYVLDSKSVTWLSCGYAYSGWPNWPAGTDFAKYTKLLSPTTNTGGAINLKKLVEVLSPNAYGAPSPQLVGLSTDGKIYQAGVSGGAWVWFPGSTIDPWQQLPARTWTDISDGNASTGVFLVSSTNEIWVAGIGGQGIGGPVIYSPPFQTGTLYVNGLLYSPYSIGSSPYLGGAPAVIAREDYSIWEYTASTNHWFRTGIGLPVAAMMIGGIEDVSAYFGQPAIAVTDSVSHLSYHF